VSCDLLPWHLFPLVRYNISLLWPPACRASWFKRTMGPLCAAVPTYVKGKIYTCGPPPSPHACIIYFKSFSFTGKAWNAAFLLSPILHHRIRGILLWRLKAETLYGKGPIEPLDVKRDFANVNGSLQGFT